MTPLAWLLLLLLAMIWGGSFISNKAALTEIGVFTVVALRVSGGAALLWAYVLIRRLPLPRDPRFILRFAIMGLLNNAVPFSLIVWGQQHIESSLASILNASSAVFGVVIAALVFADEQLTRRKAIGVTLGFTGVVTAIGIGALTSLDPTALGQWAVVGASITYGIAAAYARRAITGLRPEVAAAGMLTAAALWMLPVMLWQDGRPTFDWAWPTWAGLIWLAFVCSAIAYLLYYRVLALAGMGNLSLVGLLIPPFAILAGWIAYGERLGWNAVLGFALLAAGLIVLNRRKTP